MPVINYTTVAGSLTEEQKTALTTALTNAVGEVLGEKIKQNAWVLLNELPEGNLTMGGQVVSASVLQKLSQKKEA